MAGFSTAFAAPTSANKQRRTRHPSVPFHVRHEPFVIQPFAIHPVQAGETLKNALVQVRAVTDPIVAPLVGWWLEHYVFYVKLTQLRSTDVNFLFNASVAAAPAIAATNRDQYQVFTAGETNVDWLGQCLEPIVEWYFRTEGETYSLATGKWGAHYVAGRVGVDIFDSVRAATSLTAVTDVNVDLNANATITIGEIEQAWRTYVIARQVGMADMTFDDYLKQQGVNVASQTVADRPELLRYNREWQYPVNTVDPSSGAPTSALSWSVAMRADKDRFFQEPGFIVGVTCARPKVYLSSQNGSLVGFLNSAGDWLPKWLGDDVTAALERVVAASGSLDNAAEVVIDLRDLWEHGEQFLGFDPDGTYKGHNPVVTGDRDSLGRYPTQASVEALFVTPASATYVRQDGVMDLSIATPLPRDPLPGVKSVY